jgi:predicted PurR-regulated permease PerM
MGHAGGRIWETTIMADTATPLQPDEDRFVRKVLIVFALAGLAALFYVLSDLLMLVFSAVIVAVVLRALGDLIRRVLPVSHSISVALAALAILIVLAIVIWLFGAILAAQTAELIGRLPGAWTALRGSLEAYPFAADLMSQMENAGKFAGQFAAQLPLFALGVAGVIANLGLAIVGGVMLAMEPRAYRDGMLLLVPRGARPSAERAVVSSGRALGGWLAAQVVSMIVIGTLTGIGLWIVGVPSALGLGLFAGLAQFVPVVGPIVSAVPGLMISATTDWNTFAWAAVVYVGVQQIEGNLVTPYVQKHIAGIPMALALFSIVAFGVLFGPLGVVLATPLTLVALVLVKSLYLRDMLGEDVRLPGEKPPAPAPAAKPKGAKHK